MLVVMMYMLVAVSLLLLALVAVTPHMNVLFGCMSLHKLIGQHIFCVMVCERVSVV